MDSIIKYIPQRDPIVMVSAIKEVDEQSIWTTFLIEEENIFCSNDLLQEPGIIENIAQTAASMTGYWTVEHNKKVQRGFIGSVNDLHIYQLPQVGTVIETKVKIEHEVMNVHIIKGETFSDGKLIAECTMKIFLEE